MKPRWQDARRVARRVVVGGELRLTSPCHLGGADPAATSDRPVLRDETGRPYLPGTTLAGLLRAALGEDEGRALFGGASGDDEGLQSPLIVDDAPVTSLVPTELRDGVKIDGAEGVAGDKTKFDIELLPAGTRFTVRFELVLPGDERDQAILGSFVQLLGLLESGDVRLGARSTRGLGACDVPAGPSRWWVEDLRVSRRDGLLKWLGQGREEALGAPWPRVERHACPSAREVAVALGCSLPGAAPGAARRIRVTLEVAGSLIIRSGGHAPAEADNVHLHRLDVDEGGTSTWRPVLPGTSLAGVLRHRCLRIAQTLERQGSEGGGAKLVARMFGELSRASRVRVPEVPVEGGRLLRHTRLRIDPWTGGALESFLFTEDAWYGGTVDLEIELQPRHGEGLMGAERALLLLALRDLATGDLCVGGESAAGRGRLRPPPGGEFATTTEPRATLRLMDDGSVDVDPPEAFAADFDALRAEFGAGGAR
jgi:CRISPR/Cas system CSM-associated protein Csm3 (group 7 of RAMP superfamily)